MSKVHIYVFVFFYIVNSSYATSQEKTYDFNIKIVDQNNSPIDKAVVYYCKNDCTLLRHKKNRLHTITNSQGIANFKITSDDYIRLQGIKKDGYDIRLENENISYVSEYYIEPQGLNRINIHGGITLRFDRDISPYINTTSQSVFVVHGWKLGQEACLEKDYSFIYHDGRAEENWDIDNDSYYYLIGDQESGLRQGHKDDFDFKISINRGFYPWGNIFNKLLTSYEMEIEFNNGGAQVVSNTSYPHLAPKNGYIKKSSIKYRGINDVATSHSKRYFIKVNGRFGVINFWLVPSEKVMFEYLLNRKNSGLNLNIPSFVDVRGESSDYFTCGSSASINKPHSTAPGACASIGASRIGC